MTVLMSQPAELTSTMCVSASNTFTVPLASPRRTLDAVAARHHCVTIVVRERVTTSSVRILHLCNNGVKGFVVLACPCELNRRLTV
jgi:hypothetical protein